jgi:hypothetical protein
MKRIVTGSWAPARRVVDRPPRTPMPAPAVAAPAFNTDRRLSFGWGNAIVAS